MELPWQLLVKCFLECADNDTKKFGSHILSPFRRHSKIIKTVKYAMKEHHVKSTYTINQTKKAECSVSAWRNFHLNTLETVHSSNFEYFSNILLSWNSWFLWYSTNSCYWISVTKFWQCSLFSVFRPFFGSFPKNQKMEFFSRIARKSEIIKQKPESLPPIPAVYEWVIVSSRWCAQHRFSVKTS